MTVQQLVYDTDASTAVLPSAIVYVVCEGAANAPTTDNSLSFIPSYNT